MMPKTKTLLNRESLVIENCLMSTENCGELHACLDRSRLYMRIAQKPEITIPHKKIAATNRKRLSSAGKSRPDKNTILNYGEHFVTPCVASEVMLQDVVEVDRIYFFIKTYKNLKIFKRS